MVYRNLFMLVVLFFSPSVEGKQIGFDYAQEMKEIEALEGCFDCTLFKRLGPHCATSSFDCGACLSGYAEEKVTENSELLHKTSCFSITEMAQSSTTSLYRSEQLESRIYTTGLIIMGCAIIFAVVVIGYVGYSFFHKAGLQNGREGGHEMEAPPPYDDSSNCAVTPAAELVVGFYKEFPGEESTARVFRQPTYGANTVTAVSSIADVPQGPQAADSEETVASTWRPEPPSANASAGGSCVSFIGQLPNNRTRSIDDVDLSSEEPSVKRLKTRQ